MASWHSESGIPMPFHNPMLVPQNSQFQPPAPETIATMAATNSNHRSPPMPPDPNTAESQTSQIPDAQPKEEPAKRPKRTLKLTTAQRERKRAIDREAQRSIRIKTKNYIAHLESLVGIMEKGGAKAVNMDGQAGQKSQAAEDSDERTNQMLNELKQSQEEVRRLGDMLTGIQRIVGVVADSSSDSHLTPLTSVPPDTFADSTGIRSRPDLFRASAHESPSHHDSSLSQCSHSSSSTDTDLTPYAARIRFRDNGSKFPNNTRKPPTNARDRIVPIMTPEEVGKSGVEGALYYFSEASLNQTLQMAPLSRVYYAQSRDEDIAVRAVLHGWQDVEDRYDLDAGWQFLRVIDQYSFSDCGIIERMAILRIMRGKLLDQVLKISSNESTLPHFYRTTPMENKDVLRRAPVIEHFVWPGMRIRLSNNMRKYVTDKKADIFRRSFKFLWPHDVADAYMKDPVTNLYLTAPEFAMRQQDLRCWAMRQEFFDDAPEFIEEIPLFEPSISRMLSPSPANPLVAARPHRPRRRSIGFVEDQSLSDSQYSPLTQQSQHSQHSQQNAFGPGPMQNVTSVPMVDFSTQVQQGAEIEAWLGDPDLLPQFWDDGMASGMAGSYNPQWVKRNKAQPYG